MDITQKNKQTCRLYDWPGTEGRVSENISLLEGDGDGDDYNNIIDNNNNSDNDGNNNDDYHHTQI